ncbi:hypothetical protein [Labrenzia sp. DG1229]|uniref:hypothetical protein n=1 Tax=Labrenzia sp. DG1229 TaxID=681847 RepID=UPI00048C70A1|nr:hypothetical protein [Labrenzia sp. DG1229]
MTRLTSFIDLQDNADPAAAAMWRAYPEGPPADVYEPPFNEDKAVARAISLEALGAMEAVSTLPHLFGPETGAVTC